MSRENEPALILASQSQARRTMLERAGLDFRVVPSSVDERKIKADMLGQRAALSNIALALAKAKALSVARDHPQNLVIGADQILEFEGQIISKAKTPEEARDTLRRLRGRTHRLVSGGAAARGPEIVWQHVDQAELTMRDFDDDFLDLYCQKAGDTLLRCAGGFQLENLGAWLFSSVKGDYFTILGLPLLPLLGYLQKHHG